MTGNDGAETQTDKPKPLGLVALEDHSDRIFDDVRRLIEHEDGLVDKRIAWMLAFNGFLFAAYGLSLGAEISLLEHSPKEPGPPFCVFVTCVESVEALSRRIETLRAALVIAGCLSALAALMGVWAAMRALTYVRQDYANHLKDQGKTDLVMPAFPSVGFAALFGNAYALSMPCLVAVPWLYIWSNGYAGPLPWAGLLDQSRVVFWGPLVLLIVAMTSLKKTTLKRDQTPYARHAEE